MTDRATCLDNPIIAEHLVAIRALCREYGVARMEVFGSVCTPQFDPKRSDIDFLVEYPPDHDYGPWLSNLFRWKRNWRFSLSERLMSLCHRRSIIAGSGERPRRPER